MLVMTRKPEGYALFEWRDRAQRVKEHTKMRSTIAAKEKKRPGTAAPAAIADVREVVRLSLEARGGMSE